MDRKKKLPKDCDIFFFTVYSRNHVPELSYFFKGLFQKGLWEEILRLRTPWGYNVLGRGFCVSIFFHSHFNRPFARWRHFTTTARILHVFPFIFNFGNLSEV